ncbi:HK97-gp10 family putative phage morphogenesis protein [Flavobacterium sp. NRK1]|uniref:HK97-gp10 family putative phage morphogenesis protein n=1 Tax=Flavobacterium sp. NRK1 TaxID=2954929 RepID=UPI002093DC64|nr:HK97-gp10 family putative phage morphogenesis protein [Flavobacterium sp. NRK1]MCO6149060.1 HK97 gp10 family phage protein [Flavobacterium sp. NRK1]
MSKPLIEVTGFKELQQKLMQLADDRQKKSEMVKILRKVAQGTVKAARRNAPESKKAHYQGGNRTKKVIQPGALKKSIGVITGKRTNGNPVVYVGPRAKGNFDGFYGHFVEYGHNIYRGGFKRKHSASVKAKKHNASGVTSTTKANPFMKKTYTETKGAVTAETEKSVVKYIQKSIDRLSK